ncbi:MAG TPA: ABC transporter substrate-binding protein [Symbiobacteriaceae bacterium]|nr:ABC transporter substrate-binding protein [Symbiobacteriaceae bacterium]
MKRFAVGLLALALVLSVLSGCGSTATKKGEIVIGEIAALTGPTALTGLQEQKGVQMAIDELNAKGGVAGYTFKLVTYDFKGQAEEGVSAYKRLVQQDKAVAIIGTNFSNVNIAMAPVAEGAGFQVPVVHNSIDPRATTPKEGQVYQYSFLAQPSAIGWGKAMGRAAIEQLKAKRIAVLVNNGLAFATSQADPFKEYVKSQGATIVADESYAPGTTDYKALLTKIKAANPDLILIPQYAPEGGVAAQQARELGITAAILGPNTFGTEDFTKVAAAAAEGVYFVNNVDFTDKSFDDFKKRYEAKYSESIKTVNVLFGYDNMMIIADALKRAGSAEPKALRDALEKTSGVTILQGDGKITIDPKVHRPTNVPVILFQWKGGKAVNISKIPAGE